MDIDKMNTNEIDSEMYQNDNVNDICNTLHDNSKNGLKKLSAEEQYDIYTNGLKNSIEQFKMSNPEKYEKAQLIGDDMMNKKYVLNTGEDIKGDFLRCKNILTTILQYGLEKNDLYQSELELLKKVLVDVLNCVHDVEDIFSNIEEIETIIHVIVNKMCDYEHDY